MADCDTKKSAGRGRHRHDHLTDTKSPTSAGAFLGLTHVTPEVRKTALSVTIAGCIAHETLGSEVFDNEKLRPGCGAHLGQGRLSGLEMRVKRRKVTIKDWALGIRHLVKSETYPDLSYLIDLGVEGVLEGLANKAFSQVRAILDEEVIVNRVHTDPFFAQL